MTALNILAILLALAKYVASFVDRKQIDAAQAKGEDVGLAAEFILWTETLDERLEASRRARDAADAGGLPDSDPYDRSTWDGQGGDKPAA